MIIHLGGTMKKKKKTENITVNASPEDFCNCQLCETERISNIIEKPTEKDNSIEQEKFGIYDYIKDNPSVLIALLSACAAFATFVAKVSVTNSMKTILSVWDFNLSYINFDNNTLLFSALTSFLYFLLICLATLWYQSCEKSMTPYKKHIFVVKKLIKRLYHERETTSSKNNKEDIEQIILSSKAHLKILTKECRILRFFSLVFSGIVMAFAVLLFQSVTTNLVGWKYWSAVALSIVLHFLVLKITVFFFRKSEYSKKKIRNEIKSKPIKTLSNSLPQSEENEHPFIRIYNSGIRSFFDNLTLLICAMLLIINSVFVCILPLLTTKQSDYKNDTYRIVSLEENTYVVILQDNNRYYLERAEIVTSTSSSDIYSEFAEDQTEAHPTVILNVFIDEQRVIISNDISYTQLKFDDVVKIQSKNAE